MFMPRWFLMLFFLLPVLLYGQPADSIPQRLHRALAEAPADSLLKPLARLADYHLRERHLDSTVCYAQRLIDLGMETQQPDWIEVGYWYRGRALMFQNDYEQAVQDLTNVLAMATQGQDTLRMIMAANSLGLSQRRHGNIRASIDVQQRGLNWAKAINDTANQTYLNINLGASYRTLGASDVGLKYYLRAEQLAKAAKDSLSLGQISINLGNFYSAAEVFDSSRYFLEQALQIFEASGDEAQRLLALSNLTHVDIRERKYESAIATGLTVLEQLDTTSEFIDPLIVSLINIYEGFKHLKETEEGIRYLLRAEETSLQYNEILFLPEIYRLLAEYYEGRGDYRNALEYVRLHLELQDSLFNEAALAGALRTERNITLSEKENEIDQLEQSQLAQTARYYHLRNWFFVALLLLAAILVALYVNALRQRQARLLLSQQAAENKLEALRNQINPHFLFNSFNAIQHYILKSDQRSAYNYLTEFAHLLRLVLDNAPKMSIQLSSELDILKAYIQLEALRFQDKFDHHLEVPEELLTENPMIPSMVIQPYIENAILHGLSNRATEGGQLRVSFAQPKEADQQHLLYIIEDNGIGRQRAQEIKAARESGQHRSIAMNNTSRRLEILEKAGYPKGTVRIEDLYAAGLPAGTRVTLKLPFL